MYICDVMAVDKEELYKKAVQVLEDDKSIVFIEDLVSFLPCVKSSFYKHFPLDSNEMNDFKEIIENNKINQKRQLRKKWFDNDNATLQLALYKLMANNDERERLNTSYNKTDVTSQGESINVISLGSGTKPE